jgi:hypothetical protein
LTSALRTSTFLVDNSFTNPSRELMFASSASVSVTADLRVLPTTFSSSVNLVGPLRLGFVSAPVDIGP